MTRTHSQVRSQIMAVVAVVLVCAWVTAIYDLSRSEATAVREAELRTTTQAQVFAEYSRSTAKRINEVLLDLRSQWSGDPRQFAELVKRRQAHLDDITFQVAVIDRDGLLAYSNLAKPTERTDLSSREHFRVHKEAPSADTLFVSRPVLGKVSGKWSIQFTRPVVRNGQFDGVMVVSVSPDLFAAFAQKLALRQGHSLYVVRSTGEVMARYPAVANSIGAVIKDRPYLKPDAPVAGDYRVASALDGVERIYGYHKVPDLGMSFVIGQGMADVMAPYLEHRRNVLLVTTLVSALAIAALLFLSRSLAAREEVSHQLEIAKEQAEAASVAKSRFLATMSHEIRTPMNGVVGMTSLLLESALSREQRDYVETIRASGDSLLTIINDILDFSKIESGRLELEQLEFSVRDCVESALDLLAPKCSEKGIDLLYEIADTVPGQAKGDPTRLRQIIVNLLGNAVKFTNRGEVVLSVAAEAHHDGRMELSFAVRDTGIGIPREGLTRLFQSFSQVDASTTRRYGGTGLGLVISKRLAELMGGRIGVHSAPGEGSTFWVEIPLEAARKPVDEIASAPAPLADAPATEKPHRILLAEDNPINQMVAIGTLRKLGYRNVTVVSDGIEALCEVEKNAFDVILMDCQMPSMDGYETTATLRLKGYRLPIIAMTANAVSGDREKCLAVGMDDYVSKPVPPNALSAVLERWTTRMPAASSPARLAAPARDQRETGVNPAPAVPEPLVFDEAGVLERVGGDRQLLRDVLRAACETTHREVSSLATFLLEGPLNEVASRAHSLKGAAANLGANALAALAARIEREARSEGLQAPIKLAEALAWEFARFEAQTEALRQSSAA
jgi:signal transduction histidine kinase/DNA-binding NarL/FixJ family response regulator/HPt (histidine-containing phosphotransfer) domain-containing protein